MKTTAERLRAALARNGAPARPQSSPPPLPEPWTAPIPLGESPAPPPFPLEVFPTPLREFAERAAASVPCPLDYVAAPILALAGAAIGASRALEIKKGRTERACLYLAIVGPPSCGKTPCLSFAARPFYEEQSRLWEVYRRERQAIEDGVEDAPKPVERMVYVSDVTCEKLASILQENPRGVAAIRDELTGWVRSMDQYRSGKGADKQFWLSAWSGDPISVHRKNQEAGPVFVAHPFLSIVGGLPPDLLAALRGERAVADGFLDRILFSYPEPFPASGETWGGIPEKDEEAWRDCLARLRALEMEESERGRHPRFLSLTASGREAWEDFTNRLAAERNSDSTPDTIKSALGKMNSYGARLSLIVHCLRAAMGEVEGEEVEGEDVDRAARLVSYFQGHLRRVHASIDADPRMAGARKLLRWISGQNSRQFTRRDASRAMRGTCKEVEEMDPLLSLLERRGYIRPLPVSREGAGRKGSPTYEVNPLDLGLNGQNGQN